MASSRRSCSSTLVVPRLFSIDQHICGDSPDQYAKHQDAGIPDEFPSLQGGHASPYAANSEMGSSTEDGRQRRRRTGFEPRHPQPGARTEPQFRDSRRGLQPSSRRGRRDHVAPAVHDVDMAHIAARLARGSDGWFAHSRRFLTGGRYPVRSAGRNGSCPGTVPGRNYSDASLAAAGRVLGGQQMIQRHVRMDGGVERVSGAFQQCRAAAVASQCVERSCRTCHAGCGA